MLQYTLKIFHIQLNRNLSTWNCSSLTIILMSNFLQKEIFVKLPLTVFKKKGSFFCKLLYWIQSLGCTAELHRALLNFSVLNERFNTMVLSGINLQSWNIKMSKANFTRSVLFLINGFVPPKFLLSKLSQSGSKGYFIVTE